MLDGLHACDDAGPGCDRRPLTPTFAVFRDEATRPLLHLQLVAAGGPEDTAGRLRALLRARPDLVQRCNELKKAHEGRALYDCAAKADLVRARRLVF